jgi:hypothetical protein
MESGSKRALLLVVLVFSLISAITAQEKERKPSAGLLATYAYRASAPGSQNATIKDQRYTYLQAFYLFHFTGNQDLGVHATYFQNSFDTHDNSGFDLQRDKTYGIGVMHRFYNKMFIPNLEIYFQSCVDFESMKRKELKTSGDVQSEGVGLHLSVRPALRYHLSSNMGLEMGFGSLDLKTYRWWNTSSSFRDESAQNLDFNMNFGLNSLMLGVFVNL